MADSNVSDQPTMYSLDYLREVCAESEGHLAMLDSIERADKGAEVVLPLTDGEQVRYVWDGRELLFRSDTKPAKVLVAGAERSVRKHG